MAWGLQGTASAAYHTALLYEDFSAIEAVLMVGIAGGVPNPGKADCHVRLGDVVVSGEFGLIQYDFIKEHPDHNETRHPPRPPHAGLTRASRRLLADSLGGNRPWLSYLARAAHLDHSGRPPAASDVLAETRDPGTPVVHPDDPDPLIYPGHFEDGRIAWPKPGSKKPNAIAAEASGKTLLVPAGTYVLVKRFSTKEERRRVVAAVFDPADVPCRARLPISAS
jgi:hypothetical protein